jgi:hypothetical protein
MGAHTIKADLIEEAPKTPETCSDEPIFSWEVAKFSKVNAIQMTKKKRLY